MGLRRAMGLLALVAACAGGGAPIGQDAARLPLTANDDWHPIAYASGTPGASSSGASPAPTAPLGTHRLAVIMLNNRDHSDPGPIITPAMLQQNIFATTGRSTATYFREVSNGQLTITGRVFGQYDSTLDPTNCNGYEWTDIAEALAARDGYKRADFDHVLVYAPHRDGCGPAWATVGGWHVWLNGANHPGVVAHELGHNLGIWHANALYCDQTPITGKCTVQGYGDIYDPMGDAYGMRHFSAWHKRQIGILPASADIVLSQPGTSTVTLTPSERAASPGATQLVEVPRRDGTSFAIELRHGAGTT